MLKRLFLSIFRLIVGIVSIRGSSFAANFFSRFIFELNQGRALNFATMHLRPKSADAVLTDSIWKDDSADVCILIQGPILTKDSFTVETVKLYRRIYPNAEIVLSTWVGSEELLVELKGLCRTIFSRRPETTGSHNLNLQKTTTFAGIESVLCRSDINFILKTRTDQRFYGRDTLSLLKTLWQTYPIDNDSKMAVVGRIVELSISICKYRPWSMCDMFQFGHKMDMKKMWDFPDDPRERSAAEYASTPYRVIDLVNENVAEIRVHRQYADSVGCSSAVNYNAYYSFIKSHFIIIDKELVDLFWQKYNAHEYGWAGHPLYSENQLLARFTGADWMLLHQRGIEDIEFKRFEHNLLAYEVE